MEGIDTYIIELGVGGIFALLVIDKVLRYVTTRNGSTSEQKIISSLERLTSDVKQMVHEMPPYPQCHYDPLHFERVRRSEELLERWDDKIQRGDFSCKWTAREVADLVREAKENG